MLHPRFPWSVLSLALALGALVACEDTEEKSSVSSLPMTSPTPTATPTATPTGHPHTQMAPRWSSKRGVRHRGEACAFGEQCASGGCSVDVEGACGQCVEIQKLGEPCGGLFQCSGSADCKAGVCVSNKKTLGQACALEAKGGDAGECDDQLYCKGKPGDAQGKCEAAVPLGGACVYGYGEVPCTWGGVCDGGLCVRSLIRESGESCGVQFCRDGLFCDPGTLRCEPGALPKGAPCGVVQGSIVEGECVEGTTCGNLEWPNGGGGEGALTTCVALPEAGEPCVSGRCAPGLFCDPNYDSEKPPLCEPQRNTVGQACTNDFGLTECAPGLECRGGVCQSACR